MKTISVWISRILNRGAQTLPDSGVLSLYALPASNRQEARRWSMFKTVMDAETSISPKHWQRPQVTTSAIRVTTQTQRMIKEAYSDHIEESLRPKHSWFVPGFEWLADGPGRNDTVSFTRKER